MSEKLTKEMLDALIQEALLQEDINFDPVALKLKSKELANTRIVPNVGSSKKLKIK